MPLFRRHRGSLEESLETTVIIRKIDELKVVIHNDWNATFPDCIRDEFKIVIKPYMFDPRTGWYTQLVTSDILQENVFCVEGMLSEPLE